ncbi:MAG: RNA polymerase sigma factor [Acidobacteriota bacterium]|nr:MAG: RNA polymerase sigma factor [Acidobacteriota bacterium]
MEGLARMEIETVPEPTERLLVAHREGDRDAFSHLVERYRRPVFGYLVRCGIADADRDDLFQEIFIKIHQRANQYDAARPLHPWLFTVVANTVRTYLRKQKLRSYFVWEPAPDVPDIPDIEDDAPDAESLASAQQTKTWLERAIRALPMPQREVLILATIENLPLKDIASILEMPINTVKTHVRRARMRLVESYERRTRVSHD